MPWYSVERRANVPQEPAFVISLILRTPTRSPPQALVLVGRWGEMYPCSVHDTGAVPRRNDMHLLFTCTSPHTQGLGRPPAEKKGSDPLRVGCAKETHERMERHWEHTGGCDPAHKEGAPGVHLRLDHRVEVGGGELRNMVEVAIRVDAERGIHAAQRHEAQQGASRHGIHTEVVQVWREAENRQTRRVAMVLKEMFGTVRASPFAACPSHSLSSFTAGAHSLEQTLQLGFRGREAGWMRTVWLGCIHSADTKPRYEVRAQQSMGGCSQVPRGSIRREDGANQVTSARAHPHDRQVLSTKMEKTAVVEVSRLARHPKFQKVIKHRKKFYVRHPMLHHLCSHMPSTVVRTLLGPCS
jgi:hypothetical protein